MQSIQLAMTDPLTSPSEYHTITPTLGLRWVKRGKPPSIEQLWGAPSFDLILQQAWQCIETGETEWRDVLVEEVR